MNNSNDSQSVSQETEKLDNIIDVLEFCIEMDLPDGAAELVGRWVWIQFDAKPSKEIRDRLKAVGFRWSQRRGKWAHNCGHPSHSSKGNPFWKYRSFKVDRGLTDEIRQAGREEVA